MGSSKVKEKKASEPPLQTVQENFQKLFEETGGIFPHQIWIQTGILNNKREFQFKDIDGKARQDTSNFTSRVCRKLTSRYLENSSATTKGTGKSLKSTTYGLHTSMKIARQKPNANKALADILA